MAITKRVALVLSFTFLMGIFASACSSSTSPNTSISSKTLNVVAAENFYGDIVKQLGGNHVSVTSILSDPNVDPHEYQSNFQDTKAINNADLVIKNGDDYDSWIDQLLSAQPNAHRTVLTGADIADHKLPDNPHVWYGINNVQTIAKTITATLKKLDNTDAATFDSNLTTFLNSLNTIQEKITNLKAKYSGTPVALTETIYLYQTQPIGLNVLTPFEFDKAIAEGNDPPTDTVTTANDQVSKKLIKILIYNEQTITPITTNLQTVAKSLNIPIVPVTETMPPSKTYQTWMTSQLNTLQQALATVTRK
jgi:zinc/manganese transport system substrate-binding protein